MSLRALDLHHVAVTLRSSIKHASHERSTSDNLVVRVTLDTGEIGFGEGVPRPYVTGETIASTFAALRSFDFSRFLGHPADMAGVVERLSSLVLPETAADPRGMAGNAARCAAELAILDAYGKKFGVSVGETIPLAIRVIGGTLSASVNPQTVRYSGAITADNERKERISAWKMRLNNFSQVKIKVGMADQDDPARLARMRRVLGKRMDIRLDANEAWSASEVVAKARPLLRFQPTALEQPVPHAEVGALAELRPEIGIPSCSTSRSAAIRTAKGR